jgi:uncharacterized repeat protein (TIGR03803 family)
LIESWLGAPLLIQTGSGRDRCLSAATLVLEVLMRNPTCWEKACAVLLLCAATAITSHAQAFTTLYRFEWPLNPGGAGPAAGLIQATDGDLYGTTFSGGNGNGFGGVIFRITPSGTLTTVHIFCLQPSCPDGRSPDAGPVQATDGNLYGTTAFGGAQIHYGTVFRTTLSGTLTTLYSFCSQTNCTDGDQPEAGLVQAVDGNFYGTTAAGGASDDCEGGCGTVFRITPSGALTTLHSFAQTDGAVPSAGLIQALDGDFYGTTSQGGDNTADCELGCGTVFRITASGMLETVHSFCSESGCADGRSPIAGLIQATDGNLYGTTFLGGASGGGTVFRITPSGTLTTLYSFCSQSDCRDGSAPQAGLVQATDGNLYGTTVEGGAFGKGTVFSISLSGTLTMLYSFCSQSGCPDGNFPEAALVQDTNGILYGTTGAGGGASDAGTVFSINMGIASFVSFVRNPAREGRPFGILGQGLTGTKNVSLNGTPATYTVKSDTLIEATVPAGATTGYVTVTTPSGTLTSNVPFHVLP